VAFAAGSIHAVRAAARPLVTGGTLGMGNPVASTAEDALAVVLTLFAALAPALGLVLWWPRFSWRPS
jgi:hypothetical protein